MDELSRIEETSFFLRVKPFANEAKIRKRFSSRIYTLLKLIKLKKIKLQAVNMDCSPQSSIIHKISSSLARFDFFVLSQLLI